MRKTFIMKMEVVSMKKMRATILKQDHFGDGIAKDKEELIFIKGALKGEEVSFEVTEEKKNFKRGKILEVIKESPDRVVPTCPYYGICGGCQLAHQSYASELKWKEEKVKEILAKYALYNGKIEPIKSGQDYAYRNKVVFKVKNRHLALTTYKSNELVEVDRCLLLSDEMNELVEKINDYLIEATPFDELQLRENDKGHFLIGTIGVLDKDKFLKAVENFKVDVIYYNHEKIYEKEKFAITILGKDFELGETSFFQINRFMTEVLYSLALDEVKKVKPKSLVDLYCGTGTIGLLASRDASKVIGIEVVPEAIQNALANKTRNNVCNIDFLEGKVEDKIDSISESDFVIVDPPRRGLDKKTKEVILSLLPQMIVYVSCDVVTLARDLKDLQVSYKISRVTPVDMFPRTYHVECVCVLKLR